MDDPLYKRLSPGETPPHDTLVCCFRGYGDAQRFKGSFWVDGTWTCPKPVDDVWYGVDRRSLNNP